MGGLRRRPNAVDPPRARCSTRADMSSNFIPAIDAGRLSARLRLATQAVLAALLGASCSVDTRQPSTEVANIQGGCASLTGECDDAGSRPTQSVDGAGLGNACEAPMDCASGFCVDGVCCESACDDLCAECSASGRCVVVPEDDPGCPVVECPASNECQTYPATLTSSRCLDIGQCKSSGECPANPTPGGQLCVSPTLTVESRCDGEGNCSDARLASGQACNGAAECRSGFCVDGVCCAEACDADCEVCSAPDGSCVSPDPTSLNAACGEQGRTCVARGRCLLPLGGDCTVGTECGSGICMPTTGGGARSVCCAQTCVEGELCAGNGECIAPSADLGQSCQGGADCALGHCVDGVCCDSDCSGTCERCNAPGQEGSCVADSPEVSCDPGDAQRRCLNRGDCRLPAGLDCENNADCGTGRCEVAVGGGRVCCQATCAAGIEACTRGAAGGSCQAVPRDNGTACTTNGQCASNNCRQNRCCEAGCTGACEACSNAGACAIPPSGAEGCTAINCQAQSTDCRVYGAIGNLCEALGDCKELADCPFVNQTRGASCTLGNGAAGECDGGGNCTALPTRCGDGTLADTEVCDDGNTSNTDLCTNACQLPSCGDGFVQPGRGETCDDGGRVNGDGCSVACLFGRAPTGGGGARHQCMLRSDGAVVCWGANSTGELGQGRTSASEGPVVVPNLSNVQQLASGLFVSTCGVLRNGTVACWGGNFGTGAASVSGLSNVRQLTGASQQFCAVLGSGAVTCFDAVGTITPIAGLTNVRQLAGGANHFCAVRDDNSVWCWGTNDTAQLGLGITSNPVTAPTLATEFADVAEVALGLRYTCARSRAGGVSCAGSLSGAPNQFNTAVPVPNWENAFKIVSGNFHVCALFDAGSVQCVGSGAAGGGTGSGFDSPSRISLPRASIDVGASVNGSCSLSADSSVWCWGQNSSGQLGIPGPDSAQPVQVPLPLP